MDVMFQRREDFCVKSSCTCLRCMSSWKLELVPRRAPSATQRLARPRALRRCSSSLILAAWLARRRQRRRQSIVLDWWSLTTNCVDLSKGLTAMYYTLWFFPKFFVWFRKFLLSIGNFCSMTQKSHNKNKTNNVSEGLKDELLHIMHHFK